jgi:hypothetical protein
MATSRPFSYNSSQTTIYCADNFSTLSVGAFSVDFSSNPGGLTWWMGPDEDAGYIIAIPVPAGNFPSPIGNIANVKFFVTTAFNDSEFIALSKIVTGQTFASAADARTYLVSNGYWTNYLDADAQTFITSAAITNATQKMAINNLVTNLKLQNLWTKMTAVYPIIGGNATAHSKNLKNPSTYPISFSSGWTHTSDGMRAVTPLSAAYADTGIPIGGNAGEDNHISVYCATDSKANSGTLMGVWDGYDSDGAVTTYQINISLTGTNGYARVYDYWYNSGPDFPLTPFTNTSFGHFINTTTGGKTSFKAYVNGSLNNTTSGTVGTSTSLSLLIGNTYYLGSVTNYNYTGIISFATAGSSLTDTDALNLSTTIEKFQNSLSRGKSPVLAYDQDLTNFLLRIYAAGGTVSRNELSSLITLVSYLKNNGLWSRLSAVYPMVGGTSASCAQNLISSSFTGSFSSGWTFDYTGALPNGTSAYMSTNFNFLDNGIDDNSGAFGLYLNTSRADSSNKGHGALAGAGFPASYILPFASGSMFAGINSSLGGNSITSSDSLGMFQTSRISSTQQILFKNSSGSTFTTGLYSRNNFRIYLGAANVNDPTFYDNAKIALGYVSKYALTSTELSNIYTGVQIFNSTLARVVGKPSFSDPDSQSFIDRVYAAGGTVTAMEAAAVNSLVLELKDKGLWTKMKALYPFIGTSSAAASQNLISSSYTGTFVGSWTYGNGVTSTGGHFNTGFVPGTQSSVNGFSFGARWLDYQYDSTQTQTIGVNYVSNSTTLLLNTSTSGFTKYVTMGGSAQLLIQPVYGTYGAYIFRRTSSTFAQAYADGSNTGTLTSYGTITTDIGSSLPNSSFFFGRYNLNGAASGNYVKSKQRWGFLGLDLTDQQAKDLNTAFYNFGSLI